MKPLNPRICLPLMKAANGKPLNDAERKQLATLSTWISDGCGMHGTETGRMIIPKGEAGRTPEPWEYATTLTGLAPLDYAAVEEQAADILLTEPAPSAYSVGKSQIIQYGANERS